MALQNLSQAIQILEIADIDLVDVTVRQILEADVETVVFAAAARAAGAPVWLDRHQQCRVETFRLAILCVELALFVRGAPGQRPGCIGHEQGRRAIGVEQVAAAGRDAPEAVTLEAVGGSHGFNMQLPALPVQPRVARRADALPLPASCTQRRGESHLPTVFAIPKRRAQQFDTALMAEVDEDLHVGVGVGVALIGCEGQFDCLPRMADFVHRSFENEIIPSRPRQSAPLP